MWIIIITFTLGGAVIGSHNGVKSFTLQCPTDACMNEILMESYKSPAIIRFRVQDKNKINGNYEIDEWRT